MGLVFCAALAGLAGCRGGRMDSFFNGLLNPSEVGSYGLFGREVTLDIRSSLSLQDAPIGVVGVSDPQPEDLVPIVKEYQYQIGDILNVRIYELLQRGTETAVQVTIEETGSVSIPVIGRVEIVGLTLPEVEAEIVDRVIRRGILLEPEVIVEPVIRRRMSYTIYGTITQPSLYPLGHYELKLLDAINLAGGLLDSVLEIYVIRNQELPEPVLISSTGGREAPPLRQQAAGSRPQATSHRRQVASGVGRSGSPARPARGELSLAAGYDGEPGKGATSASSRADQEGSPTSGPQNARQEILELMTGGPGAPQTAPTPATPSVPQWIYKNGEWVELKSAPAVAAPSTSAEAPPAATEARQELIETMIGEPPAGAPTTAAPSEPVPATPSQPRWIYYNGKWIETQAPTTTPVPPTAPKTMQFPEGATQPTIDWEQIAGLAEHRVIKISAEALREGDPRHNIVIRPGDAIRLASGQFGEYYVMGQVTRPGAYSLTGRALTLKTAIASAGNLAPLAWPTHCTVYRRLGEREQMIQVNLDAVFAGREQDFFLKKDDLVLVGTHPVTPFLAVLRNAFRVSYGFGFVYDRNFADIDSYGAQPNPAFEQPRFPNLFQ